MPEKQEEMFLQLVNEAYDLTNTWSSYWKTYSNMGTWQFWVVLILFIAPLIALAFLINKKHAFQIGFYGFAIHVIAIYSDLYATTHRLWGYPHKITPYPPIGLNMDASLIPVTYMFIYQISLNKKWKYYLYLLILSILFAFIFKPLLSLLGLFRLLDANYFQLFLFYFIGGVLGKWIADLFKYAQEQSLPQSRS
ncbi:hypothetical protein LJK88_25610 [Paenibacillus sp. P26]|nr:hypothetical protein LJK88_25610 [Paenibacillus sp. P26]UUZ95210.1 hypothetical protein LJK87_12365 [Paenibacillus sp. P25]